MGAYKLEIFDSSERGRGGLDEIKSEILERERNDAYARGFKDGVSVTRDAIETERNRLLAAISEVASDISITHEQASQTVLRSTAPLVDALVRAIAPHLARSAFPRLLEEQVTAAARRASEGEVVVEVASGQGHLLAEISADGGPQVTIRERGDLAPFTARIAWAGGFDRIDIPAIVEDVAGALDAFLGEATRNEEQDRHVG